MVLLVLVAILFALNHENPEPEQQIMVQQVESVGNADTLSDQEHDHGDGERDDESDIDTE